MDTASNYSWVKPIRSKDNTAEEVRNLFKKWDRSGVLKDLKRVVTDGGGQFTGDEFQDVLK